MKIRFSTWILLFTYILHIADIQTQNMYLLTLHYSTLRLVELGNRIWDPSKAVAYSAPHSVNHYVGTYCIFITYILSHSFLHQGTYLFMYKPYYSISFLNREWKYLCNVTHKKEFFIFFIYFRIRNIHFWGFYEHTLNGHKKYLNPEQ